MPAPLCRRTTLLTCTLCTVLLAAPIGASSGALDADGVQALLPAPPGGSALALSNSNPNTDKRFGFDYQASATAAQEGGLRYWKLPASPLTYSSGGQGYTARLHLYASGGKQAFNWKTQRGYLSSPQDVRNQEFTVYVRVHEPLTPLNAQVTLKIRGGRHYDTLADWGGWQTTLRMDGYRSIDFALPSVREIAPPAP
nr:hypothetical protein [uncultured Rhodoferax sp.]